MELIDVFSLNKFICLITLQKFFSNCWLFLLSKFPLLGTTTATSLETCSCEKKNNMIRNSNSGNRQMNFINREEDDDDGIGEVCQEDIVMVMEKLGIPCNPEEEVVCGGEIVTGMFEEREASLEEVKEAFDVFDKNRDGFIDASDLQRVMYILGLRQGSEVQACRLMISAFDENGDGKIDFSEFVRLMDRWV
ncbi:hypothetical protein Ancab_005670 [Ancistrocladus abbreviatus]